MKTYGQYCPVSRAVEILGERWTLLVVRNLLLGCSTFTDIAHGVPGMSRSLLSARLRSLEDAGVIEVRPKEDGRGKRYELTDAGRSLLPVVQALSAWGKDYLDVQPEHTNPVFVLWAWVHVHIRRDRLPRDRRLVEFTFPEQPPSFRRFWILVEGGEAQLCDADPGFEPDVRVRSTDAAFTGWHIGRLEWSQAVRSGEIEVSGSRTLARQVPSWNERAAL